MDSIGFIGAGNMAEAIIRGAIKAGYCKPSNIIAADVRTGRLEHLQQQYGIRPADSNEAVARDAGIVVLSVKPQDMGEVLAEISPSLTGGTLVISIAAGIRIDTIAAVLGDRPIIRVMPNTPAMVSRAASAICANKAAHDMLQAAVDIFSAVGKTVILDNEDLMDAVTAISGSGPAYYFLLSEYLIDAAVAMGLDVKTATTLVLQTAMGAATLACEAAGTGQSCAELRRKVTSPGGTTEAATLVFEKARMGQLVGRAAAAARDRSRQLSG